MPQIEYKVNSLKTPSRKVEPLQKGTTKKGDKKGVVSLFGDDRFVKFIGLSFILLAFFLLVALSSYIVNWKIDQDKITNSFSEVLFNPDIIVHNWLGKIGAISAHFLIYDGFGVGSFAFSLISLVVGFRIFAKIPILPLKKTIFYSLFFIFWSSITLSYLFRDLDINLGGAFGYHSNIWLINLIGNVGEGLFLIFILIAFIIFAFNPPFDFLKKSNQENNPNNDISDSPDKTSNTISRNVIKEEIEFVGTEEDLEGIELKVAEDKSKEDEVFESFVGGNNHKLEIAEEIEEKKSTNFSEIAIETEIHRDEILDDEIVDDNMEATMEDYDPTLELSNYKPPTIELLKSYSSGKIEVDPKELEDNKNRILDTLKNYQIDIAKIKATIGPTLTLYEIIPGPGVRISKIKNLEDDIALSLAALGIRIIAPMPGKGTIGIEVPNSKPETVSMRSVIASEKFQTADMELPVALGKTITNETFIFDLTKMPHLLMAGATGQGKSVGLNAILVSLLYRKHPSQLKLILVDPKKVELTLFKNIEKHFLAQLPGAAEAIITDTTKVIHTLNSLCIEMDQRYEMLKNAHVRNIKEYNAKFIARKLNPNNGHKFLPYIVLVIDEFADLIMTAGKEVETPICRLAQLARAIGIHLIIATQRPSVNILTGIIKANFPARIAFRVTSGIDSKTILDTGGANQLIGKGDMLMSTGNDLTRIQCAFVDTPEVEAITNWVGDQQGYSQIYELPEFIDERAEGNDDLEEGERDSFFTEAARLVVETQQGSTSLIQRKLKLGYNRAGRIMDQLEASGIVSAPNGSKPREVLFSSTSLEQFLNQSNN